jgi:rRNA-processing protein FCF1
MIRILLDTNFLIYTFDTKMDLHKVLDSSLLEAYELYCTDKNLEELNRVGRKDVLGLVKRLNIVVLKTEEPGLPVDDLLIKISKERGFYIATQDRVLISKAKNAGIPVIAKGNKNRVKIVL